MSVVLSCFPYGLSAKDVPGNAADKVKELANPKPPVETPSGTQPAEQANPGQNPAKPAEPGNPGKPETPSKPETPPEPSTPADPVKTGNPPEQTPSGTQPAEPANPGENPANPAEPANPGENPAKPAEPANPGEDPAKPAEPADKGQPEEADKGRKDDKDAKDKKDKADKDSKNKKDKPGKGGKSGGGPSAPSLPSGVPTPPGAGASLLPAAGAAGGIIGGILSGGKKEAKEGKKQIPKLAPPVQASTETAKAAVPAQVVSIASGAVQASTPAAAVEPLYSAGKGPKIAVLDFDGESGAEFSALLSKALSAGLKVYNPEALAAKEYDPMAVNRVSARKIAAEIGVEYLVTGKVNKKSETLSIISVYLRNGKTGDIKMTDYPRLKPADDLKTIAESAALKIKERIEKLE